jgi:Ca-activated chloride channel homolog
MTFALAGAIRFALIPSIIVSLLSPGAVYSAERGKTIAAVAPLAAPPAVPFKSTGSGTMNALDKSGKQVGKCPLAHTDVNASISGYVARVTVKQVFNNPFKDRIEAVYTFPLSDSAAVDQMVMKIGSRTIKATIKKRAEARKIYETARQSGQTASLLDQERTNIFTQQVANIDPGEKIEVTLQYVDLLPYDSGKYTFAFPTVVGPRFKPTNAVPDADRITPPITPEGTRAGHDIAINVDIASAVPMSNIESKLHEVSIKHSGSERAAVSLVNKNTIPNKDFVLSWQVASDKLQSGYLTNKEGESGYFTLMVMPPKKVTTANVAPKEMIFLIDCSGSQSGAPLQKAKETMQYILDNMNPQDTFQIISFSDHLRIFGEHPLSVNPDMRKKAKAFIDKLEANGGTWMGPAVEKACSIPPDDHRLRIVTFMTDGYVGNDYEILGMIRKFRGNSRWFSFGTGNSVNRMLIDGMAKEGGGEADYVLLNSSAAEVGRKFYDRISSPVLTDVKLNWDGVTVKEVFPKVVADVWAQKPLYFSGRYQTPGKGTVTISGFAAGKPYSEKIQIALPASNLANPALGSIWARAKVDRLMAEDYFGAQSGSVNKELREEITQTALDHHIMTQYTSFVAVDSQKKAPGQWHTTAVPVDMPEGVEYDESPGSPAFMGPSPSPRPALSRARGGGASGSVGFLRQTSNSAADKGIFFARENKEEKAKKPADSEREGIRKDAVKLDPVLLAITRAPKAPLPKWLTIKDGKLLVEVWMNDISPAALKKLRALGFEQTFKADADKHLMGRIAIDKLVALSELTEVKLVEPPRMS